MPGQLLDTTTGTGTDIAGQDHSHTLADIKVRVIITHAEVIPDHIIDVITGALHDTITPSLIIIAVTHHTGDYPHIEVPQLIPEITVDPDYVPHTNQVRTPHPNPHPVTTEHIYHNYEHLTYNLYKHKAKDQAQIVIKANTGKPKNTYCKLRPL